MSFVCKITPEQTKKLQTLLKERGWSFSAAPYTEFRAAIPGVSVTAYTSGKLVVQGKEEEHFIMGTLEPEILQDVVYGLPAGNADAAEECTLHGGVDESGKGDFFGPLAVAGVVVTPESVPLLRAAGVCDSKLIHNDRKIHEVAEKIRSIAAGHFTAVILKPAVYNRLYGQIRNLNRLLAWGHARVIENLLEAVPECPRIRSDKFGDERFIRQALLEKGRQITVEQQVRGESDVAVAAASILARDSFVRGMKEISAEIGRTLPPGCSAEVKKFAKELLKEKGEEIFFSCAKTHFKTFTEIREELF